MSRLGIGHMGVSRWSRWLGLWLACVMVLPTFAQGRPDIVWMRGGHIDGVNSVVFSPDGIAPFKFAGVREWGWG
jgi:hypothetical protein